MRLSETILVTFALLSVVFLVLMVLLLWLLRSVELKLIALGLLAGLMAVWSGYLSGTEGFTVQSPPGTTGPVSVPLQTPGVAAPWAVLPSCSPSGAWRSPS